MPNNIQGELREIIDLAVQHASSHDWQSTNYDQIRDDAVNEIMTLITEHSRKQVEALSPKKRKRKTGMQINDFREEIMTQKEIEAEDRGYNQAIDDIRTALNNKQSNGRGSE